MNEEAIFEEALSRSREERAAFLHEACAGRPELHGAVVALLAAHEKAGNVLDQPPIDLGRTLICRRGQLDSEANLGHKQAPGSASPAPGTTAEYHPTSVPGFVVAGRYTLQSKIGEGGMGEVWVAKQTEPVKRRVALKLIKAGMDSKAVLQRFEQERQALALMDHPNIARVLDGGLTPTGQPFFVMELVNGLPLTKFCDEAKLTPGERLGLFVPICQAVQHAHQKGIVHRDLKPANILLTLIDGKPVPKVIDFGVAKATGGRLTDESLSTQFGAVVGTLEYMSPEQAGFSGQDVDTRADIYSLGVILYELLTGLRPIDGKRVKNAALTEMIRIIREDEPSKPSTRLSTDDSLPSLAALRHTEPRRLMAMLRGELDWIVMKCLEKSRERRYETANGLARDIQRYLADEAVEARPPSAGYRFRKFLKRHKAPAVAAGLVLAALLVGIAGTTYGLIRAEAQHRKALAAEKAEAEQRAMAVAERDKALAAEAKSRAINAFLTEDLLTQAEPANNAPEAKVTLLEVLDRAAAKVGRRFVDQPAVEASLRATIARTYHGLASWEKAEAQWRRALDVARNRDLESAESYRALGELAHILQHSDRSNPEVMKMAEAAAAGLERTRGSDDASTLHAVGQLGMVYAAAGKLREAIALFERVHNAYAAQFGSNDPRTLVALDNLAGAYCSTGNRSQAIALFEHVRDAQIAQLGADHPETLTTLNNLATAYWREKQLEKSVPLFEDVLKRRTAQLGRQHPDTQLAVANLGINYVDSGRISEAIPLLEETYHASDKLPAQRISFGTMLATAYRDAGRRSDEIAMLERVSHDQITELGPTDPHTLNTLNNLACDYWSIHRLDKSVPLLEDVLRKRAAKLGRRHPDTLLTAANLGVNYMDSGRLNESISLLEEVYQASDKPASLRWVGAVLADAYAKAGRSAEATKLVEDVAAEARKNSPKESPQVATALAQAGLTLLKLKMHASAEPMLRECVAIRQKNEPDSWKTFAAESLLGGALLGQRKYAEAEPRLVAGYEGMKRRESTILPDGTERVTQALERLVQLYEATGKPEQAAKWRKELEDRNALQPASGLKPR
jgi:tetratricopeptide (TPR) repeat protein/tRNA A-37 threonylcarbamoyl transferase component Bud32